MRNLHAFSCIISYSRLVHSRHRCYPFKLNHALHRFRPATHFSLCEQPSNHRSQKLRRLSSIILWNFLGRSKTTSSKNTYTWQYRKKIVFPVASQDKKMNVAKFLACAMLLMGAGRGDTAAWTESEIWSSPHLKIFCKFAATKGAPTVTKKGHKSSFQRQTPA